MEGELKENFEEIARQLDNNDLEAAANLIDDCHKKLTNGAPVTDKTTMKESIDTYGKIIERVSELEKKGTGYDVRARFDPDNHFIATDLSIDTEGFERHSAVPGSSQVL